MSSPEEECVDTVPTSMSVLQSHSNDVSKLDNRKIEQNFYCNEAGLNTSVQSHKYVPTTKSLSSEITMASASTSFDTLSLNKTNGDHEDTNFLFNSNLVECDLINPDEDPMLGAGLTHEQFNLKAKDVVEGESESSGREQFHPPTLKENLKFDSLQSESDSKSVSSDSVPNWRKLSGDEGSYFWNVDSGMDQYETPSELKDFVCDEDHFESVDSSLADLEGAALRYASLHINEEPVNEKKVAEWASCKYVGRMFSVQSLGWLPLEHFSVDPETNSAEVNACIKHLSSSHGQIMDGVGAWGEGKSLMLLIDDEYLNLLDPVSQAILQKQAIKHIKVWGVGGSNPHDFAYVSKDYSTRQYKCHVFRCDALAKVIAQELFGACEKLPLRSKKIRNDSNKDEKHQTAFSASIPTLKSEPGTSFQVKYMGSQKVISVKGIQTIKNVIRNITTDDVALIEDCDLVVTASALMINRMSDGCNLVNCRMRCLSFMGIGDDVSLFAFINAVGNDAKCHVVLCQPNAIKLAMAVQEACVLRFQKAVDSRQPTQESLVAPAESPKTFKQYFKNIFSKKNAA